MSGHHEMVDKVTYDMGRYGVVVRLDVVRSPGFFCMVYQVCFAGTSPAECIRREQVEQVELFRVKR